ncbi:MAG: hypothetical protein JWO11_3011 [Nocardioides sp.]|nr:hypothetical protein [Nocardioides sp.]
MRHQIQHRRRTWRSLTPEQKQERLRDLRRHQQAQIEFEVRRLRHVR